MTLDFCACYFSAWKGIIHFPTWWIPQLIFPDMPRNYFLWTSSSGNLHLIYFSVPSIFKGLRTLMAETCMNECKKHMSEGRYKKAKWCWTSHISLWLTLTFWIIAHPAPLSMGFFRQEYWSELPFLLPGDLPTQGSNPYLLCLLHCRQILYPLSHQGSQRREVKWC